MIPMSMHHFFMHAVQHSPSKTPILCTECTGMIQTHITLSSLQPVNTQNNSMHSFNAIPRTVSSSQ